ncbi:DUF4247 domain-containing protein [Rhodococcus sp. NPDC056743]|uniref:DUF4247 domain-containing protein n=1 Tax=Rhodococcus sp. NPDC056743 TaxID=3345934 RepID=UPI00366A87D6
MTCVLSSCGNAVKDFIADNYSKSSQTGDVAVYSSKDPVGTTVSRIVDAEEPAARSADGGNEYLRYDDDIVTVSAAAGGSTIKVEDINGTYRSGGYAYLGPGFNPGSPAGGGSGSGGSGSAK